MAFYTNFATENFHTVYTRISVLKGTLRRDQEVIFVQSPISSPIVMPSVVKLKVAEFVGLLLVIIDVTALPRVSYVGN